MDSPYIKRNKNTQRAIKNIYFCNNGALSIKDSKIPEKIPPEVSEHCLYLIASTFTLFCFILQIF